MKKTKQEPTLIAAPVATIGAIVLRDGAACKLVNVSGLHRGGVLMPGVPIAIFGKHRDARRAIDRTVRVRETLSTSLVADWMRQHVPSFLEGSAFEIAPVGKQS